jgi:hypothetical protein
MKCPQLMFPAAHRWPQQWSPHEHDHIDGMGEMTPKQADFWRGRFCCVDCRECTLCGGEYYMVSDELWTASGIASHGGMLCLACLERRIGRRLTASDFTAVFPKSWPRDDRDQSRTVR